MAFLPTNPALARALAEKNYVDPTPVQTAVASDDALGRDLLVSAQTGSGKTVAYGLALASTLLGDDERLPRAGDPLALIVAPTRELALQVHRELTWLYQHAGARVVSCVGGMDPRREGRELADGAHIVVGTPGRLVDHLERGRLNMTNLKAVVLDEADEMLDLGFRDDLEFILQATPQDRRTLLFSATLPRDIVQMAKTYQRDAMRIEVKGAERGHSDIEYRAIRVVPNEIEHVVVNVLRLVEAPTAIVFANTREAVRHLQATLLERGFSTVSLSGELSQNERNHALQALRDGRARVCVATDVAARGIDLPGLGLVIHADLPHDAEVMQHRSGRTGRAGKKGVSVLLVPPSRRRRAEMLLQVAKVQPEWSGPPSADEIKKLDQERLVHNPLLTEENTEEDLAMARALLAERSAEDIAAALVRLHRSQLPSPEEVFDPGERPARLERGPRADGTMPPRPERGQRSTMEGSVWFRMNVGRLKNADPRWLLPLICRQGKVTKQDIGSIKIFERETKFEIDGRAADRFLQAVRKIEGGDVRIEPADGHAAPAGDHAGPAPRQFPKKGVWKDREGGAPRDGGAPREGARSFKPREGDAPRFDRKPKYDPLAADGPAPKYEGKPKFERKPGEKPRFDGPKFSKKPGDKPIFKKKKPAAE